MRLAGVISVNKYNFGFIAVDYLEGDFYSSNMRILPSSCVSNQGCIFDEGARVTFNVGVGTQKNRPLGLHVERWNEDLARGGNRNLHQ